MLIVKNMSVTYPNGVRALQEASLSLPGACITGILGPNGGGKSTFLKGILDLVPHTGKVFFNGEPIRKAAQKTAYVEQRGYLDMDFPISVFQCVLLGTYPQLGLFRRPGKQEKQRAKSALEKLGLGGFEHKQIGTLSGGQFQRVLMARVLVQEADLIILDEPFVGVDIQSEKIIIRILKELAVAGKTILVVHHDLSKANAYFDKIVFIDKTVVDYGDTAVVFNRENLQKVFKIDIGPYRQAPVQEQLSGQISE